MTNTKKKEKIESQLFEIQLEFWKCYVIAYDIIHAMKSIPNYEKVEGVASIKQLTGQSKGLIDNLYVAKECLPQGLISKELKP
jgi:hypothetical protein